MARRPALGALLLIVMMPLARADYVLDEATYRDKVYACWLGKSIGGTLGLPVEGARETHDFTFFEPVPTEPGANDDLDLQLLWLKALEERGPDVTATELAEYWQSFVPVDWNEYGIGKRNFRVGWEPPVSGQYRNIWRDSNGAWIRSEIWACVAPGMPALAARLATLDAQVDHGMAEGTYAEVFTAVLESAAFVENDRDALLAFALSAIPEDCAVAVSVRTAMEARAQGLDLMAAREAVVRASISTGWFMAPQNVGFTILGWLYGEDDFGKTICAAVNCGDDTDCTGATVGSLWGILHGSAAIPAKWRAPVGEGIRNVAVAGFRTPADLQELTDRTMSAARVMLAFEGAPVRIGGGTPGGDAARLLDPAQFAGMWPQSPWQVGRRLVSLDATLDYAGEPSAEPGQPRNVHLRLANKAPGTLSVRVGWLASGGLLGPESSVVELAEGEERDLEIAVIAEKGRSGVLRGELLVAPLRRAESCAFPVALAVAAAVSPNDLARGAAVTSDSEYDRELGCTAKLVDGVLPDYEDDYEGKRWHSALSAHPHWVRVELPASALVGGAVLHFADPRCRPVLYRAEGSEDGATWFALFEGDGDPGGTRLAVTFAPVSLRFFRLTIARSSSAQWPDAAQLAEVELLPPAEPEG